MKNSIDPGSAHLQEGRAALNRGAWDAAREAFEAALAESETPEALEGLGWALFWLDRTEETLDTRERAFRGFREAGDGRSAARLAYGLAVDCSRPLLVVDGVEQLAELRRRQGRWDEAEELLARVESRSLSLLGCGAIAHDRGDATTAADLLERFLRRTPPDNWNGRASALELLVRSRLALGQRAAAEDSASELRALLERVDTPTIRAAVRQAEGILLGADGGCEEARRRFEDAVDLFLQSQAPFEAGRARLDLARCLAGIDRPGPAQQEARSAFDCFQKLGAAREAFRAEEILKDLSEGGGGAVSTAAQPPVPPVTDHPLTSRELEVLRLVAEGLGDKEIADRLHLSGHTVHRHISNIRTKLGLPSRSAAVAWAAQHGLL